MAGDVYVHPTALNESDSVGVGTRIWAFAHVMKGAVVGERCNIGDHAFIETGAVLGNGVTIKNGVCIWEGITLEDYVFVGPNAVFTNDLWPRSPRNPVVSGRYADKGWLVSTRVAFGASIGANATILCGVKIGRYALIGAGAVVTKDVLAHALMLGSPARRHGWVCACGLKLPAGDFRCTKCDRRYEETPDGLIEIARK